MRAARDTFGHLRHVPRPPSNGSPARGRSVTWVVRTSTGNAPRAVTEQPSEESSLEIRSSILSPFHTPPRVGTRSDASRLRK